MSQFAVFNFLDLSAAFHMALYSLFIKTLSLLGFNSPTLTWFFPYLKDLLCWHILTSPMQKHQRVLRLNPWTSSLFLITPLVTTHQRMVQACISNWSLYSEFSHIQLPTQHLTVSLIVITNLTSSSGISYFTQQMTQSSPPKQIASPSLELLK